MAIEVETRNFVENCEPKVEIKKVRALKENELPKAYFRKFGKEKEKDFVACWMEEKRRKFIVIKWKDGSKIKILGRTIPNMHHTFITEGEILHKETFDEVMKLLERAGYRLMRIKLHLCNQTPEDWSGRKKIRI